MSITIKARAVSTFNNKGNRPAQEDFVLADRDKGIFIVSDGFGGPVAGAEASKTVCESVKNFLFKEAGDKDATLPFVLRSYFSLAGNVLFNSLIFANTRIVTKNKEKNVHERGGASVIAGFIDGDFISIANVGACTARLFRNNQVVELVVPRTLGRMRDPFANVLPDEHRVPLIALGMSEDLEPEIVEYNIKKDDWIVFSTDGVPEHIFSQILSLKQAGLDPEKALQEFTSLLGKYQYTDNAAASLVVI